MPFFLFCHRHHAAIITPADGAQLQESDMADFCHNNISWFKIPQHVHFMDIFPMTASQKIQKYKLCELSTQIWLDAQPYFFENCASR